LKDEEGWEWLEEDQALHVYELPTEVCIPLEKCACTVGFE